MVRTQIQLTERQMDDLRRESEREHLSIAEIIRRALDETSTRSVAVSRDELKQRAKSVAGRFTSGRSDVSTEHDRHLDEAFQP
jgi:hypothetical protein